MAFTDYTFPDEVRGVLGISVKEVSDAKVSSTVNLTTLLEALDSLSLTLRADYFTASNASPRTPQQSRFVLLVQTFSAYTVAIAVVPSLALAAPQIITDGKTAVNRVANPFENLLPNLTTSLAYFKTTLMEAYAAINPSISPLAPVRRTNVIDTGLAVDPITGV